MKNVCGSGGRFCDPWELYATAAFTALSNLFMIPCVIIIWRQGLRFELCMGLFGLMTSILYHICEPTGLIVYGMNDGQWHRLDNVGAIMSFVNLFIYFMDNRDMAANDILKYFFLCWTLVQQERGPWQLINTILPIAVSFAMPFIKHIIYNRTYPEFHWGNFRVGMGLLLFAFYFFAKGLDDRNDYLRIHHSIWHFFISLASYWLWRVVLFHERKMHNL